MKEEFETLISFYIADPKNHAKWLNTLSYLENCGARKIAKVEHPQEVSKEMLKHAAEEFRHAFYLKQQISTKLEQLLPSYHTEMMWGGLKTLRYLDRLELEICKMLKKNRISTGLHVYILVTYAIEMRASEIYPLYQDLLSKAKSPVSVRSVLLEEKGHLQEMEKEMNALGIDRHIAKQCCNIEKQICRDWINALKDDTLSTL